MDLARTLIRSITRAFYTTEYVLVVDAILQHSAIRDDDLAHLLNMQHKAMRRLCAKLKEDGIIAIHSQQEQREGHHRAFTRDYYYVDTHRAIDATKYRLKGMTSELERKYGQKTEEVKAFACPQCKVQYTHMEILDADFDTMTGSFFCKRCGHSLDEVDQGIINGSTVRHTGHEKMSSLNKQLAPFESMMRDIDGAEVPENDWDNAVAHRIPVVRDSILNPGAKSIPVDTRPTQKTVHGLKQEVEADSVVIEGEYTPEERALKERERQRQKEEEAKKNALPVWYTDSTVGATDSAKIKANDAVADVKRAIEQEDLKPDAGTGETSTADDDLLKAAYAAMEEVEEEDSDEESDDEDDDSDDDEDDNDDGSSFLKEVLTPSNGVDTPGSGGSPRKRVRIESPKKDDTADAIPNGSKDTSEDESDI